MDLTTLSHIGYLNQQAKAASKPKRDNSQAKRPLIVPVDGGNRVPYTRVSTLAKTLDDQWNLMSWKQRKTAEGLVRRQDLITRLAGALAVDDPDTDPDTKTEFNTVCAEAMEAAGASRGASTGTGMHALTEAVDRSRMRGDGPIISRFTPEAELPRLHDYINATAQLEILDAEIFVVNDSVQAAGTFDRLVRLPDGRVVVADLKTGKTDAAYPLATTIQIATYANAVRYDCTADTRSPIHPDLDTSTGLLIHLPASGGCALYELDLDKGRAAAHVAAAVREIRAFKAHDLIRPATYRGETA